MTPESSNDDKSGDKSKSEIFNDEIAELVKTGDIRSRMDLVSVTLHSMMLDLGFLMSGGNEEKGLKSGFWKTPAGSKFRYKYGDTDVEAQLTIFQLGNFLKIHGHIPCEEQSYTTTIESLDEYTNDNMELLNLQKLETVFKADVGAKMRQKARQSANIEVGLLQLPDDAIRHILRLLNFKSIINLSMVCTILGQFCRERSLWLHLYKVRYSTKLKLESAEDPYTVIFNYEKSQKEKGKYMKLKQYLIAKRERELRSRQRFQVPSPFVNPFSFPDIDY